MRVILHSQIHEWRERTEDRRVRIVRAMWDTRVWNFLITFKDVDDWTPLEEPTLEDYEALRDVLFRKYQRRRVPWRFVEDLDAFLVKMRGSMPAEED